MVIEFLVRIGLGLLDFILLLLPDMNFSGLNNAVDYLFNVLTKICYFLPMGTVRSIVGIIVGLMLFRMLVAMLRSLWAIIPLL